MPRMLTEDHPEGHAENLAQEQCGTATNGLGGLRFGFSRLAQTSTQGALSMHPTVIALFIGAIGGIVAALCGVGGGVVMVPAFVMILKMDQKGAVATSLAAIIFTAIFTTMRNHSNGLVAWKVALPSGLAGGLIEWMAADALKKFQHVTLTKIFATVIIILGIQMWWQSFQKNNLSKIARSLNLTEDKKN